MKGIRRMVLLLLVALLASGAASAQERLAVTLFGDAFMADESGQVLIPRGQYGAIYALTGGSYAFASKDGMRYALGREDGPVTEYEYDFLVVQCGEIYCMKGEKVGILTPEGETAMPCEYTYITPNGQGGYLALRTDPYDENPDGVYRVDAAGEETPTGVKVTHIYAYMQEGLLPAMSPDNGLYGYLDGDGVWAIAPQYEYAGSFVDGCAAASASTGAGLISPEGSWLVTPQYDYVDNPDRPGKYRAASAGGWLYLIDNNTWQIARRLEGGYASSGNGYLTVTCGGETALIGPDGEELFRLSDDHLISPWDIQGSCAVISQGEWGSESYYLCDLAGNKISDAYQWINSLGNGLYAAAEFQVETREYQDGALVLNEEVPGTMRTGCLNQEGKLIVPMEYETLYALSDTRLWMEKGDTGYLCDAEGNVIAEYDISDPEIPQ